MTNFEKIYSAEQITAMAKKLFAYERSKKRLDGWFIAKESELAAEEKYNNFDEETKKAYILKDIVSSIPLSISEHNIFVGTQDDSFARSYALINPSFKVEEFSGYCDPTAVFGDIEPNEEFTKERIEKELQKTYAQLEELKARARELEEQKDMAEKAEKMKFIERNKISSEQLQLLIKFSEEEILRLLEQKEKENRNHEKEVII